MAIPKIVLNTKIVAVDAIAANKWNPNEMDEFMYDKARASIQEFGFIDPITVRTTRGKVPYEIVDGEHRWKAAIDEGMKEIPINDLGAIPIPIARKLTIILNELKGKSEALKLAQAIKELTDMIPIDELYKSLPMSQKEIDALLEYTDFDWDALAKERAEARGDGEFKILTFNLSETQAEVVESALDKLISGLPLEGKNVRANALELICADSLNSPIESYQ